MKLTSGSVKSKGGLLYAVVKFVEVSHELDKVEDELYRVTNLVESHLPVLSTTGARIQIMKIILDCSLDKFEQYKLFSLIDQDVDLEKLLDTWERTWRPVGYPWENGERPPEADVMKNLMLFIPGHKSKKI